MGNPWLDAGIVPFSTLHYRHDRDYWREWYPADFITESFPGQFRNWFYSMLVMAAALEDSAPFKTVLGFATLLDQNGEEMHKSKGNSIPFDEAAEIVGADTMRWLYANQAPEQNLRFPRIPTEEEAAAARAQGQPPRLSDLWLQTRAPLDKLWNVYSFFVTYANIDGFDPTAHTLAPASAATWTAGCFRSCRRRCGGRRSGLIEFDAQHAVDWRWPHSSRISRTGMCAAVAAASGRARRTPTSVAAYLTLYECLVTVTKLLAPFTPFLAESLYQNLVRAWMRTRRKVSTSADWPEVDEALVDRALEDETALVMRMVNLGRAAREKAQIRVRQPLARALRAGRQRPAKPRRCERLAGQVLEELNVKRLELLPAESDMLVYALKPRMKVLGPKYRQAGAEGGWRRCGRLIRRRRARRCARRAS